MTVAAGRFRLFSQPHEVVVAGAHSRSTCIGGWIRRRSLVGAGQRPTTPRDQACGGGRALAAGASGPVLGIASERLPAWSSSPRVV